MFRAVSDFLFRAFLPLAAGLCLLGGCVERVVARETEMPLKTGAQQTEAYFPLLEGRRVGLLINQTSQIDGVSLLDTLCRAGLKPVCIFAPEHGFRGTSDAGVSVDDGMDAQSGLPVFSLYGKNKKPSPEQMKGIDLMVFDIQDVGCRFYTYLSTLHYVMEACAENGVPLLLLDRPNPNDTVDGPLLEASCRSFVGMHPIPLLHGCTLGEMARMINGEGWLGKDSCRLQVVPVNGWRHGLAYSLPVRPSPNLPNDHAIGLYPSLCLFEGTGISVGRGTDWPFEVVGGALPEYGDFEFTPKPSPGAAHPLLEGVLCHGVDLREDTVCHGFRPDLLFELFEKGGSQASFFTQARFFDLLAGTPRLREQMLAGESLESVRRSWQEDLDAYRLVRQKYLLYPDYQ